MIEPHNPVPKPRLDEVNTIHSKTNLLNQLTGQSIENDTNYLNHQFSYQMKAHTVPVGFTRPSKSHRPGPSKNNTDKLNRFKNASNAQEARFTKKHLKLKFLNKVTEKKILSQEFIRILDFIYPVPNFSNLLTNSTPKNDPSLCVYTPYGSLMIFKRNYLINTELL